MPMRVSTVCPSTHTSRDQDVHRRAQSFFFRFCALHGTVRSIMRRKWSCNAMFQRIVRNYLRKPVKQELDIAHWQSQRIPAMSRKLTPQQGSKKNETRTVGLPRNFRYNKSILRIGM